MAAQRVVWTGVVAGVVDGENQSTCRIVLASARLYPERAVRDALGDVSWMPVGGLSERRVFYDAIKDLTRE